jgi:predicted Zn-dependent peptidase
MEVLMWDPYAQFKSTTLSNGLDVHVLHIPGRPWVAAGFVIHSGAQQDEVGFEGTAHFMEHMVSENGGSSSKRLREFFRSCGGSVNLGSTSFYSTQYSFFAPTIPSILEQAFGHFGNMLIRCKLERHLERERKVIVGEFYQRFPTPTSLELHMAQKEALFPNSWVLRFPRPLGSIDSINRITQEVLQEFYDSHYTPPNMSIVCVGGKTLTEIVKFLERTSFSDQKQGQRTPILAATAEAPEPLSTRIEIDAKTISPGITTASFNSTAQLPGRISFEGLHVLMVLLRVVLFEEFREKRSWTYHVGCDWVNYGDFKEFQIFSRGLVPDALNTIETVVADCIHTVLNDESGFIAAKLAHEVGISMQDINGREIRDNVMGALARSGKIETNLYDVGEIRAFTYENLLDLGRYLVPERRYTQIFRP